MTVATPQDARRALSASVICITPFTADGQLDEEGLRRHLRRMAEAGLGVWVAGSGSSEGYTLNDAEMMRILEIGVEELRGKVPIRAMGREPRTADEMVRYVKMVQRTGIDAIQIYSLDAGHLYKPNGAEVDAYLSEVLDAVDIPAVLSSHTSVGYLMPVEVLERLVGRYPNIRAIHITGADTHYLRRAIDVVQGRIQVISGGLNQIFDNFAFGGNGYVSWEGNVAPRQFAAVLGQYKAGDMDAMFQAYRTLGKVSEVVRRFENVTSIKAALTALGLPGGYPRKPRLGLSEELIAQLRAELLALELPEFRALARRSRQS